MKKKWIIILFFIGLFVFGIGSVQAGGWAVLTLESWPDTVTPNEPFTVRYALRQHGQVLVEYDDTWMNPSITAVHKETSERLIFTVYPTNEVGFYEAEIALPEAGSWDWSINAFGRFYMPPLTVISEAAFTENASPQTANTSYATPSLYNWIISAVGFVGISLGTYLWFRRRARYAPVLGLVGVIICLAGFALTPTSKVETAVAQPESVTQPSAEVGQILFQTKGCVSCHQHDKVDYKGLQTNIGPNLTDHDVSAEFLRIWLRNPADVRPETDMPNLELSDTEIESLITFLLAN